VQVVGPDGNLWWNKIERQIRADPYDINYDLSILSRRVQELNYMKKHVMKKMRPPWFEFKVIDSLDDVRHYDAGEMSFSNTSELADIADRTTSDTASFVVRGEIDTFDDIVSSTMYDPRTTVESM
jgi:hypothetical protein